MHASIVDDARLHRKLYFGKGGGAICNAKSVKSWYIYKCVCVSVLNLYMISTLIQFRQLSVPLTNMLMFCLSVYVCTLDILTKIKTLNFANCMGHIYSRPIDRNQAAQSHSYHRSIYLFIYISIYITFECGANTSDFFLFFFLSFMRFAHSVWIHLKHIDCLCIQINMFEWFSSSL